MIIRTIDAHVAGGPLRLVVDGFPALRGKTMSEKREWAGSHADDLRRALIFEPRGHADMCGAVLTEPTSPAAHAGILFFNNDGYSPISGHSIMAAAKIALDRKLVVPAGNGSSIVFETPVGSVRTIVDGSRVTFTNVPAYVMHAGVAIPFVPRPLRADIVYGGVHYAIVDAESAGLSIDRGRAPELRRAGLAIRQSLQKIQPVDGTIFTGPPHDSGVDLRIAVVTADAGLSRSPSGTGTSAVMAVLDAMGLLGDDRPFVAEGIIGSRFEGRVAARTAVQDYAAVVTEISGDAWMTGEHAFIVDDRDPLRLGFRA